MSFNFVQQVTSSPRRMAFVVGVFPGLQIAGAKIPAALNDSKVQLAAAREINKRFNPDLLTIAMDLTAEPRAFGARINDPDDEVPAVIGRLVTTFGEARALPVPPVGAGNTGVFLETAEQLVREIKGEKPVFGCMLGPISVAGRLYGLSELLEGTLTEPEVIHALVEKSTAFLIEYARAFKAIGCDGVFMAEPSAGLMSPRGLSEFSVNYVNQIARAVQTDDFTIMTHGCSNKAVHLAALANQESQAVHFGRDMNMLAALKLPPYRIVAGNLDPSAVFIQNSPEGVAASTRILLAAMRPFKNFLASSGCDLPKQVPLENIAAFFRTVRGE